MCDRSDAIEQIARYLQGTGASPQDQTHLLGTGAVERLEAKLSARYRMPHVTAVASATAGLLGVAQALELRGCEIVTTPWTYGATLAPFLLLDNRVTFADVDPETLTLDPDSVRRAITPNTRAIIAADVFGVPCDIRALRALADEFGLWLIVDGAQGFGASRDGLPAGCLADALVLSFGVGKGLSAGEGGAVLADQAISERVVWAGQHGFRQRRQIGLGLDNEFALNARIHPLAAIWADATFQSALQAVESRRAVGHRIIEILGETGLIQPLDYRARSIEPSFDRVTAAWDAVANETCLREALRERGFETDTHETPVRLIYSQPAFVAQYRSRLSSTPDCPAAEDQARRRFEIRVSSKAGCRKVA